MTRVTTSAAGVGTMPGRIEDVRHESGQKRLIGEQGDVGYITHRAFVPFAIYNPDGTIAQLVTIPLDSHVRDQNNRDYLVIGTNPRTARNRHGFADHLELELQEISGAI